MTGDEYAKYLDGLGRVDDAAALGKVDYDEVLKLRKEGASGAGNPIDDVLKETPKSKPEQLHHYASNKNQTYTPQFKEVANKYNLDLDDLWNKELLPHQGRHPNAYHDYVLENMKQFDDIAQGNKDIFMRLYESMKNNIKSNPDMLYKDYWTGK